MIYIYVLIDPRTSEVRYVGQTNDPKTRYIDHCSRQPRYMVQPNNKRKWVIELAELGLKPKMDVLFQCPKEQANMWEHQFIKMFKPCGLLNSATVRKETFQMCIQWH